MGITIVLLASGFVLASLGILWLRHQSTSRREWMMIGLWVVVAFGLGLLFGKDTLRRTGSGLLFVGLTLVVSAYNSWESPLARIVWRAVDRNPRLREELRKRGIRRQ